MARHILDSTDRGASDTRAAQYARIERDQAPRPQTKALQQRAKGREEGARTKAYTKIARQA